MDKTVEVILIGIGTIGGIGLLITVSTLLNGWALSLLWNWFLPSLGLPLISLGQAIDIAMVVGFLTYQYEDNFKDEKDGAFFRVIAVAITRPLLSVLFGLIIKFIFGF